MPEERVSRRGSGVEEVTSTEVCELSREHLGGRGTVGTEGGMEGREECTLVLT